MSNIKAYENHPAASIVPFTVTQRGVVNHVQRLHGYILRSIPAPVTSQYSYALLIKQTLFGQWHILAVK